MYNVFSVTVTVALDADSFHQVQSEVKWLTIAIENHSSLAIAFLTLIFMNSCCTHSRRKLLIDKECCFPLG